MSGINIRTVYNIEEGIGILIKKYMAAYLPVKELFLKLSFLIICFLMELYILKNFSLKKTDAGDYRLTPTYDFLCTILYTPNEEDFGLDLFEGDYKTPFYETYGYL